MDLHALVSRIADALGPEATPERVEAVAQVMLDAQAGPRSVPAALRAAPPGERAIVTAYGFDTPGILAAITRAASEAGCNILDVTQKILQGYFTLIMQIDVTAGTPSISELQQRLSDAGAPFNVRVLVQHEDLFNAMHRP